MTYCQVKCFLEKLYTYDKLQKVYPKHNVELFRIIYNSYLNQIIIDIIIKIKWAEHHFMFGFVKHIQKNQKLYRQVTRLPRCTNIVSKVKIEILEENYRI